MSPVQRFARPVVAVVVLFVIFLLVNGWWSDYRQSRSGESTETTATVDATGTPSPEGDDAEEGGEESAPSDGETASGTVEVLVDGLNFRKAAAGDAELIRGLDAGTKLDHLATEDGWYKVSDADGVVGYVSAGTQYTRLDR